MDKATNHRNILHFVQIKTICNILTGSINSNCSDLCELSQLSLTMVRSSCVILQSVDGTL